MTVTVDAPAEPGGAVALKVVASTYVAATVLEPKVAVKLSPDTNPEPVIVTDVPPAIGPVPGEIVEIAGA
ncbi:MULTISPECIES: hypothetical protein [unclassified Bradyrhizobium]|uniref:hypothetical protein n=1 Tax=unclassified Bradyrhizobium TaxID=2631580 RepID=UPI002010DDAA|nr:hypothetical protein [Bradyrhizobium sp. U87765 SZCCT0134]